MIGGSGYFQVFPVSVTPPEPAPPDIGIFNYNTPMIASNSSLDEFKCKKIIFNFFLM